MASPTPSVDSLRGGNSIGSFGDHADYLSLSPLADSPLTVSGSSPPVSDSAICEELGVATCCQCHEPVQDVKYLSTCFHAHCQPCLDKNKFVCQRCQQEAILAPNSAPTDLGCGLLFDPPALLLDAQPPPSYGATRGCTGCKSNKKQDAVARCVDCANYLCPNCVMAHQFMHCFEGHRVVDLNKPDAVDAKLLPNGNNNSPPSATIQNGERASLVLCPRHKNEPLKYYCRTCAQPVCKECTVLEHPAGLHECEHLSEVGPKQLEAIGQAVHEVKAKATDIRNMIKTVEHTSGRLQVQYHKAQNEINDTFLFYRSMLEERKQELLKELESVFSAKQLSLGVVSQKGQETVDQIYKTCEIVERFNKCASAVEILMLRKLVDAKLQQFLSYNVDQNVQSACELEFVSNYQAIQVGVRNTFGYVRSSNEPVVPSKQPPIARPNGASLNGGSALNGGGCGTGSSSSGSSMNGSSGSLNGHHASPLDATRHAFSNGGGGALSSSQSTSPFESNIISKRFSSANSLGPFSATIGDIGATLNGAVNPYEKWSNGGDSIFQNGGGSDHYAPSVVGGGGVIGHSDSMLDLTSKLMTATIFPPKSQIKRQKMIYHCKFGEFGVMEGQFTEPSGVAVNAQNDIIVADTNNHRIQIFDKEGRFKFQFGECGKRDGQLLYPNRVAVVRTSGDIIVTERSPTHQIQIYNQYGQFVRKFGANILQHPRGVTVDSKGRIVVVECKVMRVIIFDQAGTVLQKFGCSKHLEFPNGVVVNDKQEIFISDNRAHCVKVFSYEGVYLRQIGGEGITNYPIGVGINAAGEILIADNHNNFNLTIFTQDGQLVSALESKVKHAQCFDVALMDDGSVVLASKDYRLYIYRYVQVPPIGM